MQSKLTRQQAMESPSVHSLTKDVLRLAQDKDPLGMFHDVLLAASILKAEGKITNPYTLD